MSALSLVHAFAPFARLLGIERAGLREAEDIAQEAHIAAWEAHVSKPEAGRSYMIGAAKNRANGVAAGRKLTGAPSRQGRREPSDGARSWEELRESGFDIIADGPPCQDFFDRDRVRAAVRALPRADRELCYLRFWRGFTFPECAAEMGADSDALMRRWSGHVLPALQLLLIEESPDA